VPDTDNITSADGCQGNGNQLSAVSRQLQTREKTILSWLFNILGDCRVIRLRRIPRNGNQWWLCPLYITAYCLLASFLAENRRKCYNQPNKKGLYLVQQMDKRV
jgi:hypothetical protein